MNIKRQVSGWSVHEDVEDLEVITECSAHCCKYDSNVHV